LFVNWVCVTLLAREGIGLKDITIQSANHVMTDEYHGNEVWDFW